MQGNRRVLMARQVAQQWITARAHPEHRLTVYYIGSEAKALPNLLRGFRDSKIRMGSVPAIPDLGIQEAFDFVSLWTENRENLKKLASWLEEHGFETSGVW